MQKHFFRSQEFLTSSFLFARITTILKHSFLGLQEKYDFHWFWLRSLSCFETYPEINFSDQLFSDSDQLFSDQLIFRSTSLRSTYSQKLLRSTFLKRTHSQINFSNQLLKTTFLRSTWSQINFFLKSTKFPDQLGPKSTFFSDQLNSQINLRNSQIN